ncbi:MAG: 16S rRNA (cytosine(967)-C(5))-methyltransferase RsmB, partial [Deltaproteobacteria bacterium]|nr:16S rRNA (cytosine(967)-C(5))-methyltransferase RsmB [Deltaproteobacteria bacterium]
MTITPRRIALEILSKVEKEGIHADEILGKYFKSKSELSSREKAFITELVYGVLR